MFANLSSILSILVYVGIAYGLYCMSETCKLPHAWMAWVPFCSTYQLGALADHVCDRGEGRKTYFRHILLWLEIGATVLFSIAFVSLITSIIGTVLAIGEEAFNNEQEILEMVLTSLASLLVVWLLALAALIATLVFQFIAMYHIYKAFEPKNATVYTVLSILIPYAIPVLFVLLSKKRPTFMEDEAPAFTVDPFGPNGGNFTDGDTPYSL